MRTYSELVRLPTFEERFRYLSLCGEVGSETFGFDRHLNQAFYRSKEWKKIRDEVIVRDGACDLAVPGREIFSRVVIHHMNPIGPADLQKVTDLLLNPEYLICTTHRTHNAIHYGDEEPLVTAVPDRAPGDTCPWKRPNREDAHAPRRT